MQDKRLAYIDVAAGVMIVWMVLFHALGSGWEIEGGYTYPCLVFPYLHFFMPWFFYKSGFLFLRRNRDELIKKDAKKLLVPFVVWSLVGYVLYIIFAAWEGYFSLRGATINIAHDFVLKGSIPVNEVLWFLLSLCIVRWIANEILPKREDSWFAIKCGVIIVICGIIIYLSYRFNHRLLPRWGANDFAGMAFFTIGYWLRDYESKWWLLIPCAIIYGVECVFGFTIVDMWPNRLMLGSYWLWIPTALCGIVVLNNICRIICDGLHKYAPPPIRPRILECTARNAMPIYVTHALLIVLTSEIIMHVENSFVTSHATLIIIGVLVVMLPIVCVIWNKKVFQ